MAPRGEVKWHLSLNNCLNRHFLCVHHRHLATVWLDVQVGARYIQFIHGAKGQGCGWVRWQLVDRNGHCMTSSR